MKSSETHLLKHLLFLFLALSISGCSTITYVEPKSGPLARVRFVTNTDLVTVVRSYSSTNCEGENEMMRLKNGFLLNSDPKRLGIPLWNYHENAAKEFFVSANSPQIYMFSGGKHYSRYIVRCGVFIKQKFENGKDYEVSYTFNNPNCYVEVSEIKNNESGCPEKVVLQKRDSKLNSEFSKYCLTEFKKLRLW